MRLSVIHRTNYLYRRPIALGEHRLLLAPRASHELRVIEAEVLSDPPAVLREAEDVFGNKVMFAAFAATAPALVLTNRLVVELSAPDWPVFHIATDALDYPFAYSDDDLVDLAALREPLPDPTGSVASWARAFPLGPKTDTLALLKDLNASILPLIAYRPRDEEGTQSPAETLALGSGSCRDIASLFIEAARILGFGARAVSGYLYDPIAKATDPGSTHAWAEVYLPEAGWISFDPTQARVGGAGLIATAVGRRNEKIMPVRGTFTGEASDFVEMKVTVNVSHVE